MAKVSLKNVSKSYPGKHAVIAFNDLSLEIADREFVVVAGPTGCGKSTLLRLIAGLEKVSRGDIFIGDRLVNLVPSRDRDVAMVFRDGALYPHLSVRENLALGLKWRKFPAVEINQRVADAASALAIEQFLELKPRALSGDGWQRVAIARAIVRKPKVLLFEAPFSPLNAKLRPEIRKLHERLQTTIIYATSDPVEAMTMGSRIVVMNHGVVEQSDAPSTLYHAPVNQFVAGFLGKPAMNFLHGTLKLDRETLVFTEADGGTVVARLPLSEQPGAREFIGKSIVLGIRPEEIMVAPSEAGREKSAAGFRAIVEAVEPRGGETFLSLQTGAHTVVCRTQAIFDHRDAGHRMQFEMNLQTAHLFDPVSTLRIA